MLNPLQLDLLEFRRCLYRPMPAQTVVEWAEANLTLTQRQTEHPGPFTTSLRPYVREPMECWRDPGVSEVTLCWGAQTSKTTTVMAGLAWSIVNAGSPTLFMMPNDKLGKSFVKTRWNPFVGDCPPLADLASTIRGRITLAEQIFDGGGTVAFVGSNSPSNLASRPVRVLVADEVDKFAPATSREADALYLAELRLKAYSSSKAFLTSTPTTTAGPIWERFIRGDQRYYFIPCPHCREGIRLEWKQVKWDQEAKAKEGWDLRRVRSSARYECQKCGQSITDGQKITALRSGEWRPTNPNALPGVRSYHLSSLYSPDRKCTWGAMAVAFVEANQSIAGLQGFINGYLAEPWESQDGFSERSEIILRGEEAGKPVGTDPRRLMTVDVQLVAPYFYLVFRDWTPTACRLVEACIAETWEEVRDKQQKLGVLDHHVLVDSGDQTEAVYRNCVRWGKLVPANGIPLHVGWLPAKGREMEASWIDPATGTRRLWTLGSAAMGHSRFRLPLLEFNGDHILDILTRMRKGPDGCGGFRWELTESASEEYFRHLNSKIKKAVVVGRTKKIVHIWQKRSSRWPDHWLDCEIEQIALALFLKILPWGQTAPKEESNKAGA